MQRIEAFLNESEVPDWASTLTRIDGRGSNGNLGFCQATFEWPSPPKDPPSPSRFQLGPLDFRFPEGKLTIVSGGTGSGKSALLNALLGGEQIRRVESQITQSLREMHCTSGSVIINKRHHKVAFCSQSPCSSASFLQYSTAHWFSPGLEHATIRDNIIFGCVYGFDQARYQSVIEACALSKDLQDLDAGDMTGLSSLWSIVLQYLLKCVRNWREGHHIIWRTAGKNCSCSRYVFQGRGIDVLILIFH